VKADDPYRDLDPDKAACLKREDALYDEAFAVSGEIALLLVGALLQPRSEALETLAEARQVFAEARAQLAPQLGALDFGAPKDWSSRA